MGKSSSPSSGTPPQPQLPKQPPPTANPVPQSALITPTMSAGMNYTASGGKTGIPLGWSGVSAPPPTTGSVVQPATTGGKSAPVFGGKSAPIFGGKSAPVQQQPTPQNKPVNGTTGTIPMVNK